MTPNVERALEIIAAMEPWWRDLEQKGKKPNRDGRTRNEECFDIGVFAAAEFVRRLTRDEALSGLIHEVCAWRRQERAEGKKLT